MSAPKSRARNATLYGLGVIVLVGAMAAVTAIVVREHRARAHATVEALYHEDLRTAMWRMETRVGTMVATTANRIPSANAWIDPMSNVVRSAGPEAFASEPELGERVVAAADRAFFLACENERDDSLAPEVRSDRVVGRGAERSREEFQRRVETNQILQVAGVEEPIDEGLMACVGPLAPVWSDGSDGLDLVLARRVESPGAVRHETYRLSWPELRETLLAEIADLFPSADLVPLEDGETDDDAVRLASIPARLAVVPPVADLGLSRALVLSLGGAWTALLLAIGLGAVALRASFAFGEKHRRFTHAVTHELRTPLTTFRMYSEMLSRGMVPEDARAEYLATLESESTRLAGLVENVLRYARLEEGPAAPALETIDAAELVERSIPELTRTCERAGAELAVERVDATRADVRTDPGAVHQILVNLVENACKYGAPSDGGSRITLRLSRSGAEARIDVVDEGPGIDASQRRAIFEPFDRAGRDAADAAPGVGLGLALSRELARQLGGELELVPTATGATFRLTLIATSR
ncbi:MAG: HAMP domain-containing sensor histidine kinase [Planctomycetota bacterium]